MSDLKSGGAGAVSQATPAPLPTEREGTGAALTLAHFDRARHALELASSIDEVKEIRDQAEALRQYARQSRQSLEMQNRCAEIKLRAERRAGEMIAVMPKNEGAAAPQRGNTLLPREVVPTLEELGVTKMQSSRWQAVAEIPEAKFEAHIRATVDAGEELTTASLMRAAEKPHVAHNSGENEWYTPREFISAARAVLGAIELDPASSEAANKVVGAERFYTIEDDGLTQEWAGRVWMNPPYAGELIGRFTGKLAQYYQAGRVSAALALVNNATETNWFQRLAEVSAAICFPEKRVRFWSPRGDSAAPLQGQAVLYLGPDMDLFYEHFSPFGLVLEMLHE